MKFQFQINGITPLLPHADDVEMADKLDAWRKHPDNKKNSKAGDDRSPAWTWMTYAYTDSKQLVVPSDNLARCLVLAGTQITLKKQTTMKSIAASGLFIHETHMPIIGPKGPVKVKDVEAIRELSFYEQAEAVKALGFSLFVKRAAVGQSKHVRVRPRFETWQLNGTIEIICKEIQEEHLRQMFDIAGTYKGLCDWRPSSKTPGSFGRFESTLKAIK